MKSFSIIMPIFNAGRYLDAAIDSILDQSYGFFELLLIDDGSTDGSGSVCDKYARKDNRIKVFHRQNSGICKSRNFGLSVASGGYVMFCDHDDEYLPDYLETIRRLIEREDEKPDVVKIAYKLADRDLDGCVSQTYDGSSLPDVVWSANLDYQYFTQLSSAIWDGAYHRDFLKKFGLRFDERFKHGAEDFDFMIRVLHKAKRVLWSKAKCYRHYSNFGMSTSARYYPERIDDVLYCAQIEAELFPSKDAILLMRRYRRWNTTLLNCVISPTGCNLGIIKRYKILNRCRLSFFPFSSRFDTKRLTINERIFVQVCRSSILFFVYGLWRACMK